MFVTTIVALACGLASVVGIGVLEIFLPLLAIALAIAAPLCFGTLALYCRGPRQTFFLGTFAGSFFLTAFFWEHPAYLPHGVMASVLISLVNLAGALSFGWLALQTRRFAERRGWHLPPRNDGDNPGT